MRTSVWPDDERNLLEITKYVYLRDKYNSFLSYAEEKRDES